MGRSDAADAAPHVTHLAQGGGRLSDVIVAVVVVVIVVAAVVVSAVVVSAVVGGPSQPSVGPDLPRTTFGR